MSRSASSSERKSYDGKTLRILILIGLLLFGLFYLPEFLGGRVRTIVASPVLGSVHAIGLAMYSYAQDYNGALPVGKSSTEMFQKLIDEGYVTDPTLFFVKELHVPGKLKAASNVLKPENVCWDVTVPVDVNSPDSVPLIFSTGYRINYAPGGVAVPLFSSSYNIFSSTNRPSGMAVYYHGNKAAWLDRDGQPDREVTNFVPTDFDPKGKTYIQLTPDGPLSP